MRSKTASRILALLLSAAVTLPVMQSAVFTSVSARNVPTSAEVCADGNTESASEWDMSLAVGQNSLPSRISRLFSNAMKSYNGAALTPLVYYASGVVAGYNHLLICLEAAKAPGSFEKLKKVTLYESPSGGSQIKGVEDFDLSDYAKDYAGNIPSEPAPGSQSLATSFDEANLTPEVRSVFDAAYKKDKEYEVVPAAFLGTRNAAVSETEYAFFTYRSTNTDNADTFADISIISTNKNGETNIKSTYTLIGKRGKSPSLNGMISYNFSADNDSFGRADGTITFTAEQDGNYSLYWADRLRRLKGFSSIVTVKNMKAGETVTVKMGSHTAIPASAKNIIAVNDESDFTVSGAYSVYALPYDRIPQYGFSAPNYTFGLYSDVHIDKGSVYYKYADKYFRTALDLNAEMDTDYIVMAGDLVTNDRNSYPEWDAYEKMLSLSNYDNPVWESDGNHDMRIDVDEGLARFVEATGTDGPKTDKTYFYTVEQNTGDIFIFMALEKLYNPNKGNEFSDEQIAWVQELLKKNYGSHKIFLVEHSPIDGYGAGDRMDAPFYNGHLNPDDNSTKKFKALLETYPDIVFISGHTHEDFEMDYNYSNENGSSANMIHVPSLAGSTKENTEKPGTLDRNGGKGFNSQGYYVEVYNDTAVFYGMNVSDGLIYPRYSYLIDMRHSEKTNEPEPVALTGQTVDMTDILETSKTILRANYKYASYDSYQALKKLYNEFKNIPAADMAYRSKFVEAINELNKYADIAVETEVYYFTNNRGWSDVYAYAWKNSGSNMVWPGMQLDCCGINRYGEKIYRAELPKDKYDYIIFSSNKDGVKTENITLGSYNGYYLGESGSDGKYKAVGYTLDPDKLTKEQYSILYYITDEHKWTDSGIVMTCGDDGIYRGHIKANSTKNISLCLHDTISETYFCPEISVKADYISSDCDTVVLKKLYDRGSSLTVNSLSANRYINIEFDPASREMTYIFTYGSAASMLTADIGISSTKITKGNSVTVSFNANGGTGSYYYCVKYKKSSSSVWTEVPINSQTNQFTFKPGSATNYDVCASVNDNHETVEKTFTLKVDPLPLANESTVSAEKIVSGDTVTVNAKASNGKGPYNYAAYYKKSTSSTWSKARGYSSDSNIVIKPAAAVKYDIRVKVKDSTGKVVNKDFTVEVVKPLKNTSTISSTTIVLGDKITVNASASGGHSPYMYSVWYKKTTSESWTLVQNFSANAKVNIRPAKATTYSIKVKVKDSDGTIVSKTFNLKLTAS